ncbi:hypothetical protein AN189_17745 [Loktanella sp. 3ANDIMAR09]|uniref:hypothetical protein n=1 Tax=Loktanella sp. 3ANDIMAR09 TaxID=1225657 RepID=UPI000700552E|nr:hypothetical protein [Loktanella sp. 3ANDIMAR09]KQI67065.1 hypothetical protein AN189_17745 [Loktanella sp. 3ANDIMAR09]
MTEPTTPAAIYINPADAFDPDVSWSILPFGENQCKMVPADALDAAQAENARLRALLREADRVVIWESQPLPSDYQQRVESALEGRATVPAHDVAEAARDALMVERIDDVAEVARRLKIREPYLRAALAALAEGRG